MEYYNPFEPQRKRPSMLTVLAILTFIGSGLNFLTYLFLSLSTGFIPAMIEAIQNLGYPDEFTQVYEEMANVANWLFLLLALTYALAIVGAAIMLKLNKIGFHLYITSQILLFCISNLLIGGNFKMGILSVVLSLIFILLYGLNYKYMKSGNKQEPDDFPEEWRINNE